MNNDVGKVSRICRQPVIGDRLIDKDGQLWVMATAVTLSIAQMEIDDDGEVFVYE